jgi:hypothetical protein
VLSLNRQVHRQYGGGQHKDQSEHMIPFWAIDGVVKWNSRLWTSSRSSALGN